MSAALRESWIWLLLAFLVGLAVGWFLRRTTYTTTTTTDTTTTTRISELEAQLEECREAASLKASTSTAPLSTAPLSAATADAEVSAPVTTRGQVARVAAIATPVPAAKAPAKPAAKPAAKAPAKPAAKAPAKPAAKTTAPKAPAKAAPKATATRAAAAAVAAPVVDLAAGAKALGRAIKLDDLTVVEGIGPKIAELFTSDGITTWRALSKADVPRLQRILDAAGPRYRMHDPKTWPKQAGLLADGKWAQFVTLTDKLSGGR